MKVRILPAKRHHFKDMKNINEQCLAENYSAELWEATVLRRNSFILEVENKIVGYCLVNEDGIIFSFAILENYRGKGLGEKLLREVINHLTNISVKYSYLRESTLQVRVSNKRAISLYEKLGFQMKNKLPEYYADGEDGYLYVLTLNKMIS